MTTQREERSSDILVIAAGFGALAGLLEGAMLFVFQEMGWLTWNRQLSPVSIEIVWISAVLDLLLFVAVGLGLWAVGRWVALRPTLRASAFVFAFLTFFSWIAIPATGRIRLLAMISLALGLAAVLFRCFLKREARAIALFRRKTPWLVAAVLLAGIGIEAGLWLQERIAIAKLPASPPEAPNVLVVIIDTLRADHLSAYGYHRATSPNLDRRAHQGVLFEAAISTSSWSLPAHASLMTGQYAYQHGAMTSRLDARHPTLAEVMRSQGFRTAAFSANSLFFCRFWGFGRGFIRFEDYFHSATDRAIRTVYGNKFVELVLRKTGFEDWPARKAAADVNRSVLRWVERDPEIPFLAVLNYLDVHEPYLPPEPYRSKFSKQKQPGGILNSFMRRVDLKLSPEQIQGEIDAYDGAIAYMDSQLEILLSQLDERTRGNLLVIVTSDHGESFGEHGTFLHGKNLYRESIQVPLVYWWPGHVPGGVRVQTPVSIASIPASVVRLVLRNGTGEFPTPPLNLLWESPEAAANWPSPIAEMEWDGMPMRSLVSLDWHYIDHGKRGQELFHWRNDPKQSSNLAASPDGKPIADRLADQLKQRLAQPRLPASVRMDVKPERSRNP